MVSPLLDRLEIARRNRFVGRASEIELFRNALQETEFPFFVLHLFGPGGVGKTSLLREFSFIAAQMKAQTIYLDSRNVEPSPDFFSFALSSAIGLSPTDSVAHFFAANPGRYIILIDTSELLAPLDSWLRDVFLPQLPANVLVVFAGRTPPSLAWRTDPGWQTMMRIVPLRNLSLEESRAYLTRRNVPAEDHEAVLDFTHGHALALSLVADAFAQRPGVKFQPEDAPDIIKTLLEQFVQKVPGPAHRAALEACALVRLTTEPLLSIMLDMPDVHELFEWLRDLSFIDSERRGIFPHDLAREALVADLRWRNPEWYAELHTRARHYYMERLQATNDEQLQRRILFSYIFLHRDNPAVRPYFEWQESGTVFTDHLRPQDVPAVVEMVRRHEGERSAQLAAYWLERQPDRVSILRDATRQTVGFLTSLALDRVEPADLNQDPGLATLCHYLQTHHPLRPKETALAFRFWMGRDTYQAVSPIQSRIFLNIVQQYLTTPRLAFTFLPCENPDFWTAVFGYADLARLEGADFTIDGRRYGVYGHDWRIVSPMAWLNLMAEREIAASPTAPAPKPAEPLVMFTEESFAEAVRDALRFYTDPAAILHNPLLKSRLITTKAGPAASPFEQSKVACELLMQTAITMQYSPRLAKLYRAVYHTYFQPAETQEKAAELLDLPFSTYRRHLRAGIDFIAERLWQQEVALINN